MFIIPSRILQDADCESTRNGLAVATDVVYLSICTRLGNLTRRRWLHTPLLLPNQK